MYLLRLDDASPHWNGDNWHRMHDLLKRHGVVPVVAIIPDNRDEQLLSWPEDYTFFQTIKCWIAEGWTPALHGLHHTPDYVCTGVNPVSEFAGAPLENQKNALRTGDQILGSAGINCRLFVAPYHTFDASTVKALKAVTDIRIISDTVARDVFYKDGVYFIPQQSGGVRRLPFALTTFCYHPNVMVEADFARLDRFLANHSGSFTSFDQIQLKDRRYDIIDLFLSKLYKMRRIFS